MQKSQIKFCNKNILANFAPLTQSVDIMANSFKLDKIDRKILDILQRNGKITNAQLSKEVNLSPAPTLERVKKLETSGFIENYYAKLNPPKLGLTVTTFLSIKLSKHNPENTDEFVQRVAEIDEVVECHYITGSSDYLLKVVTRDIQAYQELIQTKIGKIDGIDNMQTMVVLSTPKDSNVLPIYDDIPEIPINNGLKTV